MCLSIPSQITKIDRSRNMATVDTMGVAREASLDLIDQQVDVGDYVLIHIGFAMNKIDEADALQSLEAYREIIAVMEAEELEQFIAESDSSTHRGEDE
jgi:hydrogenase expression/formation protein HypC